LISIFNQQVVIAEDVAYDTVVQGSARADEDYEFTIECENNSHITDGGDATGYFIIITNEGRLADTITLSWEIINVTGGSEPDPKEWDAYLNKNQVSLNPLESAQIILNVSTGCGCQIDTVATIRVTGQSVNSPSKSVYIDTFTTRGPEIGDVELELTDYSIFSDLIAGQEVSFRLEVFNPQQTKHTYKLRATNKPNGWQLLYSDGEFFVNGISKVTLDIFLTLPLNNNPGEYKIKFIVESTLDPYINDDLTIEIPLLPELSVKTIDISVQEPIVNEKLTFNVDVENLGPAIARNIQVNYYDHEDRSIGHLIGQDTIVELSGNSETRLNFSWTPKTIGEYNITIHVDPENIISEVGNRYFNNLEKFILTVHPKKEDKDNEGNGAGFEMMWVLLVVAAVVVVLIIIFFMFRRSNNFLDEKTAKKIPLNSRSVGSKGKLNKKRGKTAKKIRMHETARRGHSRTNGRGSRSKGKSRRRNR
jgi:uncharacterized membrane protein